MQALPLCLFASAILLTSSAGGSDLQKTSASDSWLRGPVSQCTEQTTYLADEDVPERSYTNTSVYSPRGWLLQTGTGRSSGPDYVTTYTYDTAGHLLKIASGTEPVPESNDQCRPKSSSFHLSNPMRRATARRLVMSSNNFPVQL